MTPPEIVELVTLAMAAPMILLVGAVIGDLFSHARQARDERTRDRSEGIS